MKATRLKFEITTPEFFATPLKKLAIEDAANIGRTYFLKNDRIVAVAISTGGNR